MQCFMLNIGKHTSVRYGATPHVIADSRIVKMLQCAGFSVRQYEVRESDTGHGENTGGLQVHSMGDDYPFAVVGTQHKHVGDPPTIETRYYVLNAVTGERWYKLDKVFSSRPMTWVDSEAAHKAARSIRAGVTINQHGVHYVKVEEA